MREVNEVDRNKRIGFWLRAARERAGLSQTDAAKRLGLKAASATTLTAWEKGNRLPSHTRFEQLADIYEVPVSLFTTGLPTASEQIDYYIRGVNDSTNVFIDASTPDIAYAINKIMREMSQVIAKMPVELHRQVADTVNAMSDVVRASVESPQKRLQRIIYEAVRTPDPLAYITEKVEEGAVPKEAIVEVLDNAMAASTAARGAQG